MKSSLNRKYIWFQSEISKRSERIDSGCLRSIHWITEKWRFYGENKKTSNTTTTNSQLKRGTSWVRNNYFFVQKINASGNINSCKLHKHVLKSRTKRGHFIMKPWNSLSCDWAIHFLRIRPIDLIGLFFLNIFLLISGDLGLSGGVAGGPGFS